MRSSLCNPTTCSHRWIKWLHDCMLLSFLISGSNYRNFNTYKSHISPLLAMPIFQASKKNAYAFAWVNPVLVGFIYFIFRYCFHAFGTIWFVDFQINFVRCVKSWPLLTESFSKKCRCFSIFKNDSHALFQ